MLGMIDGTIQESDKTRWIDTIKQDTKMILNELKEAVKTENSVIWPIKCPRVDHELAYSIRESTMAERIEEEYSKMSNSFTACRNVALNRRFI